MPKKQAQRTSNSPPEMRARVDRAVREGKFQTALDLAKQLHRAEPNPDSVRRLVVCYLGRAGQLIDQGSTRDAAVVLDAGLKYSGDNAEDLLRFAEAFARCGEVTRALQLLKPLPEPQITNRVLRLAADVAMQRGAAGRSLLPETLRAEFDRIREAFAHLQAGQDEAARQAVQGIGLGSPFLEWKLLLRGLFAYYQNEDQRAIDNWSRLDAARLPARLAAPLRLQIDRDFATAQPPATQQALRRQADRLQPDPILAGLRTLQSALVKAQGRLVPAFREAEAVVPHLRQRDPELVNRLARIFYWEIVDQGQPEDMNRYERLFGKPADDPDFARMAALALERGSAFDGANKEWQTYEKSLNQIKSLTDAERARARALVWFRMGKNAERHAAIVNVANHLPFLPFGPAERPRPLNPGAEKCFARAAEFAPDWLEPHDALVEILFNDGKLAEAIKAAEKLLQRFPEHLPTIEMLARFHFEAGEFEKNAAMLERALAVNPLNRPLRAELQHARRRLGIRLAMQGQFTDARAAFEAAIALAPELPHPFIDGAWAACELKAGNAGRAEELLNQAFQSPEGGPVLHGWLYALAMVLKLPKKIKERFEKPFKILLDVTEPTPGQVAELLNLFAALDRDQVDYHGAKTHRKKAVAQAEKTLNQPYSEELMQVVGLTLLQAQASRVLRKLGAKWSREFPQSPWPPYLLMESYMTGHEERWPLWRLKPLAAKAKALAEKMPASPARDHLLQSIEQRVQQFRDLNPFSAMIDEFGDYGNFAEDDSW